MLDEKVKEMPTYGRKAIRTVDWIGKCCTRLSGTLDAGSLRHCERSTGDGRGDDAWRINAIQGTLYSEGRRAEWKLGADENLPAHKRQRIKRLATSRNETEFSNSVISCVPHTWQQKTKPPTPQSRPVGYQAQGLDSDRGVAGACA